MMRMPSSVRALDLRSATRSVTRSGSPRRATRAAGAALVALAGIGVLGACSNGGAATSSATSPVAQGTLTGGPGAGQRTPGVNGLIAAVSGTTMQVQSSTKQTAVSWTATTRVTHTATGTLADIVVGSCVVVRQATSGDATAAAGAASGPVTAASVQVMPAPAAGASCLGGLVGGLGGGFGGRGTGGVPGGTAANGATGAPDGAPAGAPTGAPGGGFGGRGFGVVGAVTAVDAGGFTVASIDFAGAAGAGATSGATLPTTPVAVTTSATTTVTTTRAAAAADIKVGLCASAQGQTDQTGAMTATSITLRDAVNGACTNAADGSGFGGPGGRPGASPTNG